ncbi:MAG: hypothetical protein WBM14_11570 [Terracidiphilus sp.]
MHLAFLLMQNPPDPELARKMAVALLGIVPIIIIVVLAIVIVPFWFICKKAGFSPWLSLLNIIPLGNLVLIYVLAFAEWRVMPVPQPGWPPMPPMPPAPPRV